MSRRRRPSHPTHRYAQAIASGKILAGEFVRLACKRHLADLRRKDIAFDEETATRAIEFFPDMLRFTKGEHAGQPFVLQPWQQFIVGSLFGWKRKTDGLRRFRHAFILVAKKSGKTEMAAGVGLYGMIADGERSAEVYSAATTRDQASLTWRAAKQMVDMSPELGAYIRSSDRHDQHGKTCGGMWVSDTNSTFFPLGRDRDTIDGINPHVAIIDELHRHKNRDVFDVITASNIARQQPLVFVITTAGAEAAGVCWTEREFALKVLRGEEEKDDFFCYLAEIDENDDWQDESAWPKANPNLGISFPLEALRGKYQKAKASGPDQAAFIRYHCNRYTADPTEAFVPVEAWARCDAPPKKTGPCFVGLDLSDTQDWCAAAAYWPDTHSLDWMFFLPEEDLKAREDRDHVSIRSWANDGLIKLCPGRIVDRRLVRQYLTGIFEGKKTGDGFVGDFEVVEVIIDRWSATSLLNELTEDGVTVVPCGQGFRDMSPASRRFLELAIAGDFRHGDHAIAKWMLGNTRVIRDNLDNIRPIKVDGKQGRRRIDGIVAAIMAVGRAAVHENAEGRSVYDERGIIELG